MVRDSTSTISSLHQVEREKEPTYRVSTATETLFLTIIHNGYTVTGSSGWKDIDSWNDSKNHYIARHVR